MELNPSWKILFNFNGQPSINRTQEKN
jgi:hypothetical protein